MKRITILAAVLLTVCTNPIVQAAEAPGSTEDHKIIELSRSVIPGSPAREAILYLVELGPGVPTAKHYHNGQSLGTVLEGALYSESTGEPRVVYGPGDFWNEAAKHVHSAGNASTTAPVRFIVMRIVPKGLPVTVPVP